MALPDWSLTSLYFVCFRVTPVFMGSCIIASFWLLMLVLMVMAELVQLQAADTSCITFVNHAAYAYRPMDQ